MKRLTFKEILETTKEKAAESAWGRAADASRLRRRLTTQRRFAAAQSCGEIKARALELAASLLPERVRVTIDDDYQVGLLSIRWKGRGRFHLPLGRTSFVATAITSTTRST